MLHVISAQCVACELHTIALRPLECTCWRQFAGQWGDCKKSRSAPLNAIFIIIIIMLTTAHWCAQSPWLLNLVCAYVDVHLFTPVDNNEWWWLWLLNLVCVCVDVHLFTPVDNNDSGDDCHCWTLCVHVWMSICLPLLITMIVVMIVIPVKSYIFSVSLTDFQQFSSLTAYGKDLTYFREKITK